MIRKISVLLAIFFALSIYPMELAELVALGSKVIAPLITHPAISIPAAACPATLLGVVIKLDEQKQYKITRNHKQSLSILTKIGLCAVTAALHSILITYSYIWYTGPDNNPSE